MHLLLMPLPPSQSPYIDSLHSATCALIIAGKTRLNVPNSSIVEWATMSARRVFEATAGPATREGNLWRWSPGELLRRGIQERRAKAWECGPADEREREGRDEVSKARRDFQLSSQPLRTRARAPDRRSVFVTHERQRRGSQAPNPPILGKLAGPSCWRRQRRSGRDPSEAGLVPWAELDSLRPAAPWAADLKARKRASRLGLPYRELDERD